LAKSIEKSEPTEEDMTALGCKLSIDKRDVPERTYDELIIDMRDQKEIIKLTEDKNERRVANDIYLVMLERK
jgi:hypothetical protein